MKLLIGITDCNRWDNYKNWFASKNVQVLKLSSKENNISDVERCDGIVLSGGEDVHPKYYGYPEWMQRKEELKLEVNEIRDKFEMRVIDHAYRKKIPMLGICRGLQIANVYFGGTLIPDINLHFDPLHKGTSIRPALPSKRKNKKGLVVQHSKEKGNDRIHIVKVETDSCLNGIVLNSSGKVNSAHHQAADKIGKKLKVSARAEDGTVEAIEWKNPKGKPFLLLLQWHPERMKEQESAFAKTIREKFLERIRTKTRG